MEKGYYIVNKGQQAGPYSFATMQKAQFDFDTRVWTTGLNDWVWIDNLEAFNRRFGAPVTPAPPPILSEETQAEYASGIYTRSKFEDEAPKYRDTRFDDKQTASVSSQIIDKTIDSEEYAYSPIWKRLFGSFVNWLPGIVLMALFPDKDLGAGIYWAFVFLSPLATYYFFSGNLGHAALGMKVIVVSTGKDFRNPILGALRELLKGIFYMFILPCIWLLWDVNRQNVYDKIFDTVVVDK